MTFNQRKTRQGVKLFIFEYKNATEMRNFFLEHGLLKSDSAKADLMELARYDHEIHFSKENGILSSRVVVIKDGQWPIEEYFDLGCHEIDVSLKQVSTHRIQKRNAR